MHRPSSLIGRAAELDILTDVIVDGGTGVVLLAGEPGVGKTTLVAEAVQRSGRTAMIGSSSPASLGRPFDLVLSAVEPVVRWWTAIPAGLGGVTAALTHLLRPVAPGLPEDGSGALFAPADLIGAAIALIRELDPDVFVAEDIHWADIESLQVLERTLAGAQHPPVIATYRSEELDRDHPASELIRMLERRVTHLHLVAFGPEEVRAFVGAATGTDPDPRSVERLTRRTGGNPFFLEQLVLGEQISEASERQLPWTLSESLRRQLEVLSPDESTLLDTAAVLGSPFDFDLLAHATGLDESAVIDRLRGVVSRNIVVEDDLDVFRFRHELVREAVVEAMLGRERRRLHDRCFEAVQALRPNDFAELARHARGAERYADLVAVAPLGVRHYLRQGSTFQALKLAQAGLHELPGHPELTELAARAAWMTGRLDEARPLAERWLEYARREEPHREHEALELIARLAFESGDDATQAHVIAELEAQIGAETDPRSRAMMLAVLAQHLMLRHDSAKAIKRADEAIALADEHGYDDIRRRALLEKYSANLTVSSEADAAMAELERVAKDAEANGDDVTAARAWHNLMATQPTGQAEQSLNNMRDAAIRCGFDSMAVNYYSLKRVELAVRRADLDDARHWAGRSLFAGQDSTTGRYLAVTEARLALEAGQDDDAERIAAGIPTMEAHGKKKPITDVITIVNATVAARRGDPSTAAAFLSELPVTRGRATDIIMTIRELTRAGVAAETFRALLDDVPPETSPEAAAIAEALVGWAEGSDVEARLAELADAHLLSADHQAYPEAHEVVIRAEIELALADIAARRDDATLTGTHARAALDLLADWPGPRRSAAVALLSSGDGVLTDRELDVVRLVARGMSNGAIGDELFIARKTVSTHVSNVLSKLGMSSRTEIGRWAVEQGLAEPD